MKPVTIILPIFNEETALGPLLKEIDLALAASGRVYEVIAVDDGSTDGSLDLLKTLSSSDPRIKVVSFSRNYGQTAALACGFTFASHALIATLDADGQNPPSEIPALLDHLNSHAVDAVCGWRKDRKDSFLSKRLPSIFANCLIRLVGGPAVHDQGCTLRVYKAKALQGISLDGELHRLLPLILHKNGTLLSELAITHRARISGRSHYNYSRIFKVLRDASAILWPQLFGSTQRKHNNQPLYQISETFGFEPSPRPLCESNDYVL